MSDNNIQVNTETLLAAALPADLMAQPNFEQALKLALAILNHGGEGIIPSGSNWLFGKVETWADAEVTPAS